MKIPVRFSLLIIFIYIVSACNLSAQGRNSITGFVFGESRTPIADVYVELLTDTYSPVSRMRTNNSGLYSFRGLGNAAYIIRVLTAGTNYEEQSQSVSLMPISVVSGGGAISEQVMFYLKLQKNKRAGADAAPEVVFVQEVPEDAKKTFESGVSDLEKQQETGLLKIKESIEIFPDYFLALDRLGNEYLKRGYYLPASALFTKAITVNPKSFSSTFGLGLSTYRLNRLDEAIKHFDKAITISGSSINAHLWRGIVLHSKNNLSEALTSMIKADKLSNGTSAEVHFQLARVYKDLQKFSKAAEEMELYLKYDPDNKNVDETKRIIKTLREKP